MNGNPFYVEPMGGYGPSIVQGLSGLGSIVRENQEKKRLQALNQEAASLFSSGDTDRIAEFSIANPEIGRRISEQLAFKNEETKKNFKESMERIIAGEDPRSVIEERAQMVQKQGGDPIHTLSELAAYDEDPQVYIDKVKSAYALSYPQEFLAYRKAIDSGKQNLLSGNLANLAKARFGTADVSMLDDNQRAELQQLAQMSGSGGSTAADIQKWDKYQQLLQNDPSAAEAFGRQAGFVDKNKKISSFAEKQLSGATDAVFEAQSNVASFEQLANDIDNANLSGGILPGKWAEALKDFTGQQDAVTDLRKKFNLVRASQSTKFLPPGPATDRDVQFALSGFPSENANGEQLSRFLRGMAKLEQNRSAYNEFRANYIDENKSEEGLLRAWKESNGIKNSKQAELKPAMEKNKKYDSSHFEGAARDLTAKYGRKVTAEEVRQRLGM